MVQEKIYNRNEDWWDISFFNKKDSKFKFGKKIYLKQHRFCPSIFHINNREYYYLNAILFKEDKDENSFTSNQGVYLNEDLKETIDSAQEIKNFPFFEKTFIINVINKKIGNKTFYFIKDKKQLEEVWKYYKNPEAKKLLTERL
jgi:hypothetical protein